MKRLETLQGRKAFRRIGMSGSVFDGRLLRFIYLRDNNSVACFRFAVLVAKRNDSAVRRNFIKRRIREACRAVVAHRAEQKDKSISVLIAYQGPSKEIIQRVSLAEFKNDVVKFVESVVSSSVSK